MYIVASDCCWPQTQEGSNTWHFIVGCQTQNSIYTSQKYYAKYGPKERYNTKYKKDASNSEIPLMKHEEGVKIRLFSVLKRAQKQKHPRLINHAKMEPKKGYKGK